MAYKAPGAKNRVKIKTPPKRKGKRTNPNRPRGKKRGK